MNAKTNHLTFFPPHEQNSNKPTIPHYRMRSAINWYNEEEETNARYVVSRCASLLCFINYAMFVLESKDQVSHPLVSNRLFDSPASASTTSLKLTGATALVCLRSRSSAYRNACSFQCSCAVRSFAISLSKLSLTFPSAPTLLVTPRRFRSPNAFWA